MVIFSVFGVTSKRGIVVMLLLVAAAVFFGTQEQATPSSGIASAKPSLPQSIGLAVKQSSLASNNPFATLVDSGERDASTALDVLSVDALLHRTDDSQSSDTDDARQQVWHSPNSDPSRDNDELTWVDTISSGSEFNFPPASTQKRTAESDSTAAKRRTQDAEVPLRQDEMGGDLEIGGRVLTSAGRPINGQLITASRRSTDRQLVRSSISDRSGAFLIDDLTAGDYLLRAEESARYAGTSVSLRAGQRSVTLVLPVRSFALLAGTISDAFGNPIPGATVILTEANGSLRADEEGYFLGQVPVVEGQGLFLRYRADGYLDQSRNFDTRDWDDQQPLNASVRMRSAGLLDLTGIVFDESGQPIEDALVRISSRERNFRLDTRTTSNGEFLLEGILAATDVEIKVAADRRFEPFFANRVDIGRDSMQQLRIVLRDATLGRMIATVYDASGDPVPQLDFIAVASGQSGRVASLSSTITGQLTLEDFTAGAVTLKSKSAPTIIVRGINLVPGQDNWYPFTIDVGDHMLRGRVVDAEGFPVRGAQVSMSQRYVSGDLQATTLHATASDSSGVFSFKGVGGGPRTIVVAAQDYADASIVADPAEGGEEFRVALHR